MPSILVYKDWLWTMPAIPSLLRHPPLTFRERSNGQPALCRQIWGFSYLLVHGVACVILLSFIPTQLACRGASNGISWCRARPLAKGSLARSSRPLEGLRRWATARAQLQVDHRQLHHNHVSKKEMAPEGRRHRWLWPPPETGFSPGSNSRTSTHMPPLD
jgi:hypothetical protein